MAYRQSSLATDTIPYRYTLKTDGNPVDPTANPVSFAFMLDDVTKPGATDWVSGTWETWTATGADTPYRAVTPSIGPAGAVTSLAARTQPYYPWIRVTLSATNVLIAQLPPIYID